MAWTASAYMRLLVWEKSGGVCFWCGHPMIFGGMCARLAFSVDHLKPTSAGGSNLLENLVGACRTCNSERAAWSVTYIINHQGLRVWNYGINTNGQKKKKVRQRPSSVGAYRIRLEDTETFYMPFEYAPGNGVAEPEKLVYSETHPESVSYFGAKLQAALCVTADTVDKASNGSV